MAFSGNQITRLGLSGITRGLYADFSGKATRVVGIVNRVYRIAIPLGLGM